MKKLNITWQSGIEDTTGFLFSLAKSLGAALNNSPYQDLVEDIVATSGFAFRLWVNRELCPSAMSIWDWEAQPRWVASGGLACDFVGRYWDQDAVEAEKRAAAHTLIVASIDRGFPVIAWDIGLPEWGLITGYDEQRQVYFTLPVTGDPVEIPWEGLGKQEIPILSVMTIKGRVEKSKEAVLEDTLRLALAHLKGQEPCENLQGLAAYPALIQFFKDPFNPDHNWGMEYYLGTYAGLKYYAHRYLQKAGMDELADVYRRVWSCWQTAFEIKHGQDIGEAANRQAIAKQLTEAYTLEQQGAQLMEQALR